MYINDVHIMYYVVLGLIGLLVGQFVDWCNTRLPEYKKIFPKNMLKEYKKVFKPNYVLMIVTAIIYLVLLYILGIGTTFMSNIRLLKYLILTPMLLSVVIIDYKMQIIPNRLNLTMFEIGIIFVFLQGMESINVAIDGLLGMLVGGGIFLLITLIGGIIAGKEAMGFGDVKLMGALGLFFGWIDMLIISALAFLIGAILSIILLATKKKKTNEYIPFGPFIVLATFIVMCIPSNLLITALLEIFTLGMYQG